ncbi:MAG TPA: excinuclease ABC subunit UvrA [Gemmatales bacterium]|nr:excinuclease ABC subunit UvrA [Gemmatales bacterium]
MDDQAIIIRGAREHNLRNVNLTLPRNRLIVFTGVSGSGKSSLAFDTLFAEGQRRYIESLSSYARQFLGQLPKPDVDFLGGLAPAISIQQKTAGTNPRSTVGTITEIHDFLRVLFARLGQGFCPKCHLPIAAQTREQMTSRLLAEARGRRCQILAPVVRGQKGEFKDLLADMLRRGYIRARVDGQIVTLTDDLKLERQLKHSIEIVVDRVQIEDKGRVRLDEAIEQALRLSGGDLIALIETGPDQWSEQLFSAHYACTKCGDSFEPPSPQLFSFNSPQGMCLECDGLGQRVSFAPDLLIPDPSLSFAEGAVATVGRWSAMGKWRRHIFDGVAQAYGIDLRAPWKRLTKAQRDVLLYGSGTQEIIYSYRTRGGYWRHAAPWEGIVPQLVSSFKKVTAGPRRLQLEKYMRTQLCPLCDGQRLNAQARAVRLAGQTLVTLEGWPIGFMHAWFAPEGPLETALSPVQRHIASELLKEIRGRLQFLLDVGLDYLSLDRTAPTLSGGEAQRIRLASQIGCGLVGVMYILDEPSIGLHPRDNARLLRSLERLRDLGNTVIVVEHDEETMAAADFVVDFGPGPGVRGGEVVAAGRLPEILKNDRSLTARFLSGRERIAVPSARRTPARGKEIRVVGATHNNLQNLDVAFPLGTFIAVTGVSGSGKSSLVNDVLLAALKQQLRPSGKKEAATEDEEAENGKLQSGPGAHKRLVGVQHVDKVIAIDQAPIGRTPRSNPATYIKLFDEIRTLFSRLPQAKIRGYAPGRFSFNVPGGRCEACSGNGSTRMEMDFLADVWVPCPVCESRRFNRETLQVRFKEKSVHEVLEMDVQEALEHFSEIPRIRAMLQTLHDVGLDYLKLGQPSPTLSGGEAQRIKLARELCHPQRGHTLYILDEPTTGLHFADIRRLLEVLHGFVKQGHTVIVIEHNLDVIKTADWVIDLGPEGGSAGGRVVAAGPPEAVADCDASYTGTALRPVLERSAKRRARAVKPAAARWTKGAPAWKPLTAVEVRGARQHNLKDVTIAFPREAMTVCAGPSGSGKSSFAIDTVFAEGQRRYVESLSSYARQFLGQVQKPKVEQVHGLSPAICIEQKTTSKSPRSTVGTVTEIHDYLRILFARLGHQWCPRCGVAVGTQTADEIIDKVMSLPEGAKLYVLAPLERKGQESYETLWEDVRRAGFLRVRVDGTTHSLDQPPIIDRRRRHEIEVLVDRIVVRSGSRSRVAEAIEAALDFGRGVIRVAQVQDEVPEPKWPTERFSQHLSCDECGRSFEPLAPHHFSFNSPLGWCPTCEGLGTQLGANPALLMRGTHLSLADGALAAWPPLDDPGFAPFAQRLARHLGIATEVPFGKLRPAQRQALLHGCSDWLDLPAAAEPGMSVRFQYKGILPTLDEAMRVSHHYRHKFDELVSEVPCADCQGSRLRDDAAAVRFQNRTLGEIGELPLCDALTFFRKLKLTADDRKLAGELLREIEHRLQFLVDVGLDYLTLNRSAPTLSGGEAQRIRLASQIGSGLTGVLYVLDEPTIGLHPRDNRRLLAALCQLRDLGNTLLLVEHDREVIEAADCLLDFGPGAGAEGGAVVAQGTPAQVRGATESLTGAYLVGRQSITIPLNRRSVDPARQLILRGARQNNLQNVTVAFPLGCLIAVTGVSGSGKSSLVNDCLFNGLARRLHRARTQPGIFDGFDGLPQVDKVINVDQQPLGSSPMSNPATACGAFDLIRHLFAQLPDSRVRGYTARRFSFNVGGGRCTACQGLGQKLIEMHFLPDVWIDCEECQGTRYAAATLDVKFKGQSIADVLRLPVRQALALFAQQPRLRRILQTLDDVGLGYLALGQAAPTLSGGEAQRVKLAAELGRPNTGRTVYILDEPTTGLHFDDIRKLLEVLHRLADLGNTVIVVEHNLDVIKSADWLIDMGPEAGTEGGRVVAAGTPEEVVATALGSSHTARVLKEVLAAGPHVQRTRFDPKKAAKAEIEQAAPATRAAPDIDDQLDSALLPWENDGVAWHTHSQKSPEANEFRWDGAALRTVIGALEKTSKFSTPNWNHRTTVEVAAKIKSHGWFLHASTQDPKLLWLTFRVAKRTFEESKLAARLKLPKLSDVREYGVVSDAVRVRVKAQKGPWQSVELGIFREEEVTTPAFKTFLQEAIVAFEKNLTRLATDIESLMPWRIDGKSWHRSDKGFPPRATIRWPRPILDSLLEMVQGLDPSLAVNWTVRDCISLKPSGCGKIWARWWTKEPDALRCQFLTRKGQLNLARIEPFGSAHDLETDKPGWDTLWLRFRTADEIKPRELKKLLGEVLTAFREVFPASS